jgi:hypothetical protein
MAWMDGMGWDGMGWDGMGWAACGLVGGLYGLAVHLVGFIDFTGRNSPS